MPIGRVGDDFVVNSTVVASQFGAAATALTDGRFVIVWQSNDPGDGSDACIRGRIYNVDGTPDGADFVVNTTGAGAQIDPAVTALDGGGFVVAWTSLEPSDGSASSVRGRLFNADGSAVAADFLMNSTVEGDQRAPTLIGLAGGFYVASWTSRDSAGGAAGHIQTRVFSVADGPLGDDFLTNSAVGPSPSYTPSIAVAGGRFMAVWATSGSNGDGSGGAIRGRVTDAEGDFVAADFIINTSVQGDQFLPVVAGLPNGRFVVAWQSNDGGDGSQSCIRARILNANGSPVGADFIVNPPGEAVQFEPVITALADGRFVIAWGVSHGSGLDITLHAQLFNANGSKAGEAFQVNSTGGDLQDFTIAGLTDGRFIVSWSSTDDGDGDGRTIRAALFDPNVLIGTGGVDVWQGSDVFGDAMSGGGGDDRLSGLGGADVLNGDSGNDVLNGGAGNDVLDGGTGADRMTGGAGNDTYAVDNAGDVVIEAVGGGTDRVNTSVTWSAAGQDIENIAVTGTGRINIVGNDLNNVMTGNSDVNALNGGRGADRMVGGGGNDLYYVDNVGDVVVEAAGGGTDTVRASISYTLGAHQERLQLVGSQQVNAIGNALDNVITGNARANVIIGMGGRDLMTGGAGADRFDFRSVSDSAFAVYDRITDLADEDVINLSAIDANANVAGDQAFVLVSAFTRQAGQLTLTWNATGQVTVLTADVNGDGLGDFRVILDGDHTDYDNFRL